MHGSQTFLDTALPNVVMFERGYQQERVLVAINLSDVSISEEITIEASAVDLTLPPYGYAVLPL